MTIKKIQKLNQQLLTILEDNKALDCALLDIRDVTDIADYMIIASGSSKRHIHSLGEKLALHAKKSGFKPLAVCGNVESDWILVDLGAIIIHTMMPETRKLYALEELWDRNFTKTKIKPKTIKKKSPTKKKVTTKKPTKLSNKSKKPVKKALKRTTKKSLK